MQENEMPDSYLGEVGFSYDIGVMKCNDKAKNN